MLEKIIAFIMAVISFFSALFTGGSKTINVLDVSYGSHSQQSFDLYLPKKPADERCANCIVIYIHGGAWTGGDKSDAKGSCEGLAEGGYAAAATLNYRLLTENNNSVDYNDMLDDIDAALARIKEISAEKGYSIDRAALIGYSAGAHLAMLYAYSRAETAPLDIRFVNSAVGPADFTDEAFYTGETQADIDWKYKITSLLIGLDYPTVKLSADNLSFYYEQLLAASPINYITASAAPSLLNYGSKDILVPVSNAERLVKKLTDAGAPFDYVNFPNSGHGLDSEFDEQAQKEAGDLIWQYYTDYLLPV